MSEGKKNTAQENSTPNSDIVSLPGASRDAQVGVEPLTPEEQLKQLSNFLEDNYPEIFSSLTTDQGAEYTGQGQPVPQELKDATERWWSKVPDLLTHSSQLVLGAGLDHSMPQVAFCREGISARPWGTGGPDAPLPEGVGATVLQPDNPNGALAVSLHGGPGWFGDAQTHDQLWQPLFAGLAQLSGVTIVDLTYPLPLLNGEGKAGWAKTQEAVRGAFDTIVGSAEGLGCDPRRAGIVAFGSGLGAAATAVPEAKWLALFSPRIGGATEGLGGAEFAGPVLISLAAQDSRATPREQVESFASTAFPQAEYQEFLGEHIIAPPASWRERVSGAAQWLGLR